MTQLEGLLLIETCLFYFVFHTVPRSIFLRCATCRLGYFTCPGHFGHIELPSPVYHPLFMTTVYKLLRATCLFCHHFKVRRIEVSKFISLNTCLNKGPLQSIRCAKPHQSSNCSSMSFSMT